MAKKRICLACNQSYSYCGNCNDYKNYPAWMAEFDKIECKEIFDILSAYNMKLADESQVKAIVNKYNITDFSVFTKPIADKLNSIYKRTAAKVKEVLSDEAQLTEEQPTEYRPRRNRRYNKNNTEDVANTDE